MQPPPRTGPPGASGPPPSGPNMFRRTRPHKYPAAATMPPVTQPMTDPFAFVRAPPPMAAGGLPSVPNNGPPQLQAAPSTAYSQPSTGPLPHSHPPEVSQVGLPGPSSTPSSSFPGLTLFSPHGTTSPSFAPAPVPAGYASYSLGEQAYFNSKEQTPSTASEPPHMASGPVPSQTPSNQEFHGQPPPQPVPFQPVPPQNSSAPWPSDHGSRPPSVQNYFQPTNDPPQQSFNLPAQNQMYPSSQQSTVPPHQPNPATTPQPGHPQDQAPPPFQNPVNTPNSQWPDPNVPQHHNSHLQMQGYFTQSSTPHDSWFNQPPSDSGYHQMATSSDHPQSRPDSASSHHLSNAGAGANSGPALVPYSQESGSLSMFFNDNDVENEETLAGEKNRAVNGGLGSFHHHSHPQPHTSHGDGPLDYQAPPLQDHSQIPYMNDGNSSSHGVAPKPLNSHDEHVENLECVPNQEVLPSEALGNAAAAAVAAVDQFETGPNLETPDSIPRPMRSASVSSNYSNMSHGSGTASRRHQGVMGTFIQQESPRLTDEAHLPLTTGGYFEQIDTSPAGDVAAQQSSQEQTWPSTPSPPKPTGIFQASANSSFEPVRSHGVGVRPPEVDRAKVVAEGGADSTPGNLEQPPDNMENIYSPGHPLPAGVGVVPHLTHPVVHSHSRPSSRAFGASRPCESPATTLWAQNDPTGLAANILLAPAAPTVLAPLREPSADVIQPPEDGPLDLQPAHRAQPSSQQHLENLENPPKVSEVEPADPQGNLGYASLLVPDSLQQPVLIAPPVSSYSVITPSTSALESSQTSAPESVSNPSARPITQGPKSASVASSQNPLFAPGPINFTSSASHQNPLNLTHDKSDVKSDTVAPSQPQQVRPPLARGQSQSGDSHSSLQVHPQASVVTTAASNQPSNYELLDFSMHQSQNQIQASGHPSSLHESSQSANGFYLQVTKDAQHGMNVKGNPPAQTAAPLTNTQPAPTTASHATASALPPVEPQKTPDPSLKAQTLNVAPAVPVSAAPTSHSQYPAPAPASAAPPFSAYPPGPPGPAPPGTAQPAPADPPRPPSSAGSQHGSQHGSLHGSLHGSQHGSQHGHGPSYPPPGQMYGGYYGYYGEYNDGRAAYPPGQYAPFSGDPRYKYYQDGFYRGQNDPWYGRYKGQPGAYRDPNYTYREPPPERPSSRASQYSDRPSSRQGYPEDFHRANQSAYSDHYVDYPKPYDYSGYNYGQYDPRYKAYYDSYWSNHDGSYTGRDYYNSSMYPPRNEDYDNQWQYYPGYDTSFDDDRRRPRDVCADDFDRRSVRSEHSARSVQSSHSHHSRQSSFSSQSQQSQVYRNQADPVSAAYDTTVSTLAAEYSYGPYPHQTDTSQNYYYPSEYNADNTWNAPEQPPPRPATPEKFTVPHRCARFGPGGHLIQVLPNLPSDGQPALVDIHSMETILQDSPDQAELRGFPGPLVKEETHKVDVIKFSQSKAVECSRDNDLLDRDSARLLWDFIMLLCRQNGTVVGTDIADLLLKEHRSVWLPGKSPNEANLIDFNNEPLARAEEEPGAGPLSLLSDTFMTVPENVGKETERFRELLLFGRKKDALEAAMKGGLWGHALLLASKMDNRTHARVMIRFANSLPINDPLQTVYQLMSGRMPASATCCGEEKWGDWRPHLAMVLSNLTHSQDLDTRTISTMGDTLASKGLIDAAHFCYLMAQVGLGVYTKKSTKMVLIGSNHSLPFFHFATNEAIQRTEAYEYAQSLGSQPCSLPNFQVFKLIYACRLAEAGLSAQAFHYCEVISRTVLQQPAYYSPIFISQIIQMSEKLRFFDPQLKEKPEKELFDEPEWLIHLRQLDGQIKMGQIKYNEDRRTPTQFECSTPSSDMDESSPAEPYNMPVELDGPAPDNPLMSSLLPGPPPQGVQLMPPAPTSILQDGMPPPQIPHEVPQFYPVPPSGPPGQVPISGYPPQDPGFAPPPFQPQQEQLETYPAPQQPGPPAHQPGQMSPHMPPQVPHSPVQMNPPLYHVPQHAPQHMPPSPGHMPHTEHLPLSTPEMSSSPPRGSFTPQKDFYDQMAHMGPGRRSRTTSQSSLTHMAPGRRSRTTSESSTHSGGRERSNSTIKQTSPPPPSIPEQPRKEEQQKKERRDSPKKSRVGGWIKNWWWKGKNEAHLPADDKPSIVWDEQKQKWVDLNEPEEESKPLAPPPSGFPSMPQMPRPGVPGGPPGGGPPVNMFSRKAGPRSRYVDVLNPGGTTKPGGLAPAPADIFAPLAPMPMPANLFVPSSAPDDQQPLEGSEGGNREQNSPNASAAPQTFNPTLVPPAPEVPAVPDGSQSGENHPGQGAPPTGGVTFYNPAQFAQTSAPSGGGHRTGRLGGQRQYPVLK